MESVGNINNVFSSGKRKRPPPSSDRKSRPRDAKTKAKKQQQAGPLTELFDAKLKPNRSKLSHNTVSSPRLVEQGPDLEKVFVDDLHLKDVPNSNCFPSKAQVLKHCTHSPCLHLYAECEKILELELGSDVASRLFKKSDSYKHACLNKERLGLIEYSATDPITDTRNTGYCRAIVNTSMGSIEFSKASSSVVSERIAVRLGGFCLKEEGVVRRYVFRNGHLARYHLLTSLLFQGLLNNPEFLRGFSRRYIPKVHQVVTKKGRDFAVVGFSPIGWDKYGDGMALFYLLMDYKSEKLAALVISQGGTLHYLSIDDSGTGIMLV